MNAFLRRNASYLLTFVLLFATALVFLSQIAKGDESLYFAAHRSAFANFFFRFATHIGEPYVYIAAAIALLWVQYRHSFSIIFVLGPIMLLFSESLKRLFGHPRPVTYFEEILHHPVDSYLVLEREAMNISWTNSFPSGHTISAFAFYGFMALLAPNHFLRVLCMLVAALVAMSRVYLFQHFLEDVTSGALVGTVVALITYAIHHWLGTRFPALNGRLGGK